MTNQSNIDTVLRSYPFAPIFKNEFNTNTITEIDLSANNKALENINVLSLEDLSNYISSKIKNEKSKYGIGGYLEDRFVYRNSKLFGEGEHARTIHLGIDIWCESGSEIYCPADAVVHSFNNNNSFKDYGPTIILKHQIKNLSFYTLYGHLSLNSIKLLKENTEINMGEKFAEAGNQSENGNWPPHLHFQLILDMMDYKGDFPGVVSKNDLSIYSKICPDPNIILQTS